MQYIDTDQKKIKDAADYHYNFIRYVIKKKLNGKTFSDPAPVFKMNNINLVNGICSEIKDFLNDEENLKLILTGKPEELDGIKDKFKSDAQKRSLKKLISYKSWTNTEEDTTYRHYNAYHLAQKLDIPTCVYCNRIYTKTVISESGKMITRPTFDHWFPKGDYPILALSFFNLIPSCSVCNSGIKGSTPLSLSTHFHPYYINPAVEFNYTFSYDHKDYDKFKFKIITPNRFSANSVDAFKIVEVYKAHEDEIEDMRKIKDAYSENYIEMLERNILGGISLDRNEVYRIAFGVHFQEEKFDRRPLSKMKKDILTELGIIKKDKS